VTTRDEFEEWANENWIGGLSKMIALRAWQTSRLAALEEVARAFEAEHGRTRDRNYWLVAASMVRALAKPEGE